jgi:hypothetical protein
MNLYPKFFKLIPHGWFEKDYFNRRALKAVAKDTKLKHCKSVLCDLGEKSLRPLRLMDFGFFKSPYISLNIIYFTSYMGMN